MWDDWMKIKKRRAVRARLKFGLQIGAHAGAAADRLLAAAANWQPVLAIPFFKGWLVNLGWLVVPFALLVVVGASNAVNLTDGLDGLAIGPIVMAGGAFGIIAYLTATSGRPTI
jgi:phospho-N-acetylmuramoyl-pentapeptide-transferase